MHGLLNRHEKTGKSAPKRSSGHVLQQPEDKAGQPFSKKQKTEKNCKSGEQANPVGVTHQLHDSS
jgi:hypothetical protein